MTIDEAVSIVKKKHPDARIMYEEDSIGCGYYIEATYGVLSKTIWDSDKAQAQINAWLDAANTILTDMQYD